MIRRPSSKTLLFVGYSLVTCIGFAYVAQVHRDGYRDTPILPGQKWHVHDINRPYPHEVTPGKNLGDPPSDAIVLFDGKDLSQWTQTAGGGFGANTAPAKWKLVDKSIEVAGRTGNLYSREKFGDCQLHIEWLESPHVKGSGQGRGNSGIFLMSHYEVQVLDSYRAATYADGQAGAIYGQWPPLVNPQRKPGEWQAYDIIFEAPVFENGKAIKPAYETIFFNGVLVHNHQKLNGESGHATVPPYVVHGSEEPLFLQDHGPETPVRYRNIWVRKLKGYDQPEK